MSASSMTKIITMNWHNNTRQYLQRNLQHCHNHPTHKLEILPRHTKIVCSSHKIARTHCFTKCGELKLSNQSHNKLQLNLSCQLHTNNQITHHNTIKIFGKIHNHPHHTRSASVQFQDCAHHAPSQRQQIAATHHHTASNMSTSPPTQDTLVTNAHHKRSNDTVIHHVVL